MDSETTIEQGAAQLIDLRLSLSEILGQDWKQKCIFQNVASTLENEGVKSLNDGEEVSPNKAESTLEKSISEANRVFDKNSTPYHARLIVDAQGTEKAFIVGKIGNDSVYITTDNVLTDYDPKRARTISFIPNTIGLVSKSGQVLSIDKILQLRKNPNESNSLAFIEIEGRDFKAGINIRQGNENDTITSLPKNYIQLGTLLHEIGHLLRKRIILRKPSLELAATAARNEFDRTESPDQRRKLTMYQARKIRAGGERSASAIGISLLRDAGQFIGLDCASHEATNTMFKDEERALKTYDQAPYMFDEHDENSPIPAFSQEMRRFARKLHQEMKKHNRRYSSLPNFDQYTGENLANNPKKILEGA